MAGILYPARIDNYCKIVKGVKGYGRYMDDIYAIHESKEFLRGLLDDIEGICSELGIVINRKKTQIVRLSHGFTFLKIRYIITDSGRVVMVPSRGGVIRERRKLKKLKKKVDAGLISAEDVRAQYKSWRGSMSRYRSHRSVLGTDALYKSLYGGTYGTGK